MISSLHTFSLKEKKLESVCPWELLSVHLNSIRKYIETCLVVWVAVLSLPPHSKIVLKCFLSWRPTCACIMCLAEYVGTLSAVKAPVSQFPSPKKLHAVFAVPHLPLSNDCPPQSTSHQHFQWPLHPQCRKHHPLHAPATDTNVNNDRQFCPITANFEDFLQHRHR